MGCKRVFAANIGNICKKTKSADRANQVITGRDEYICAFLAQVALIG